MKRNCDFCNCEYELSLQKRKFRRFCTKECRSKCVPTWLRRKTIISELSPEEKLNKYKEFFFRDVIIKKGCWDWTGFVDKDGYSRVTCRPTYGPLRAARASWIIHNGNLTNENKILHVCDNRRCTNPDHLRIGTCQENSLDMVNKKRQARGSKNGNAKLNEENVKEIMILLKNGLSYKKISKMFNVHSDAIANIKRKKTWNHVEVNDAEK